MPAEETWVNIVSSIADVSPEDRLSSVSRFLIASSEAAQVISPRIAHATNLVRVNSPVSSWLPNMIEAKSENILVIAIPLDLLIRTTSDYHALREAFNENFYIRSVVVDVRLDLPIIEGIKNLWHANHATDHNINTRTDNNTSSINK